MSLHQTLHSIAESGKKVLIVGLGISGVESARFLLRRGIPVVISEKSTEENFRTRSKFVAAVDELRRAGAEVHFGIDGEGVAEILSNVALTVLSPGVPLESSIVGAINRHGVPYVSELELGVQLHGGKSIVVTGSNGKSTTVTLIDHILKAAGVSRYLCGNVGTPVIASDEIDSSDEGRSLLVVEASSYQLEACTVLKPAVSVLLNVSENHLERHGTIERYAAAKARVLKLQDREDLAVLNSDDPIVRSVGQGCRASVAYFGVRPRAELEKLSSSWASIDYEGQGAATILVKSGADEHRYSLSSSRLLGRHNAYNVAAAALVTSRFGVSPTIIQSALESFAPLEHRLETIFDGNGLTVINDSKSTTVAASVAAYSTVREHFRGRAIAFMIGGLSKAGSWDPLLALIERNPSQLPIVCFGKDGPLLANHCRARGLETVVSSSLSEGTAAAIDLARSMNGIVVLSPGCASFDEFRDFEQRGEEFKRYVHSVVAKGA